MTADDFNGDGRGDLLWRNDSGMIGTWLARPDGGFVNSNWWISVANTWHVAGTGDFNGDGRADVIWRHDDGHISEWLGQQDGSFVSNHALAGTWASTDWHIAGTGDFNGDSRSDVLWVHSSGVIGTWLGQANGSFANSNSWTAAGSGWNVVGTGDFDGDGHSDILWQSVDGFITNWLGTDNGGFALNGDAFARMRVPVAAIGDFNGDNRDDIIIVDDWSFYSGYLARDDGSFDFGAYDPFADASTGWQIASVGDYNGDGADDLFWRNTNGLISSWLGVESDTLAFTDNPANVSGVVPSIWQVQLNPSGLGFWDY